MKKNNEDFYITNVTGVEIEAIEIEGFFEHNRGNL